MAVKLSDLLFSFDYVSSDPGQGHEAFLCRQSGHIYWHSEFGDNFEELPEDIDDDDKYVRIPNKHDLDLGRPLVFAFISERLPEQYEEVRRYFGKRGAYARFKDLLVRKRALEEWYKFEESAQKQALREWCEQNSIEITEAPES
jgi:hypothetical protein